MAVKAMDSITIMDLSDVVMIRTWYKSVLRTAAAPTVAQNATEAQMTSDGWGTTEPSVDTTKKLYTVQQNVFGDGSYVWGDVSLDSSYEAAIEAFNRAVAAEGTATNYLELVSGIGLKIAQSNPGSANTNHVLISGSGVKNVKDADNYTNVGSSGFQVYQDGNEVAIFGADTRVGQSESTHISIDSDSIDFYSSLNDLIGYINTSKAFFPSIEATDNLYVAGDYVLRKTPSGLLGLYKR